MEFPKLGTSGLALLLDPFLARACSPLLISEGDKLVSARNCGALCIDLHEIVPKAPRRAEFSSGDSTAFLDLDLSMVISSI